VNTKIERLLIPGVVGPLEALLEYGPQARSPLAALVCHPHPQFGGTMHNKVVFRAAKAALQVGVPALRFNFRGAGKSRGTYADGIGEREDVRAALDYLQSRFPETPLCLMGFSFGAWVGLAVGAGDPRVTALVGLGIPLATSDLGFLGEVSKPKLFVQGTLDEFGPADQMQTFYESLAEPKQIHWVQGADHFFAGKLGEVQSAVREFLKGILRGT
jgi:alpha/beta superfamily hydrolase